MLLIYEEVASIVGILRENPGLSELEVRSGSRTLRLRRAPSALARSGGGIDSVSYGAAQLPPVALAGEYQTASPNGLFSAAEVMADSVTSSSLNVTAAIRQIESSLAGLASTRVTSELVGVFRAHRKSEVTIGSQVDEDQSLGQIEAMRLLNDCPSPIAGRITAILVQDGEPVEYGQPLFELAALEPAS